MRSLPWYSDRLNLYHPWLPQVPRIWAPGNSMELLHLVRDLG